MIKNSNENTMEVRIVIVPPENAIEESQADYVNLLDDEEFELSNYAESVATHLETLMNKTMLDDELLWLVSFIVDMGMSNRPWEAVNLIKAMFLSAENTDGRKAINRVIDLCGDDEDLYEFFMTELIESDFIDSRIEEICVNHDDYYEED